jgi:hypothetical protein
VIEPGTRVELVACDDEWTRLQPGDQGTVTGVVLVPFDDRVQVWIDWDDGSRLALLDGVDAWREVA